MFSMGTNVSTQKEVFASARICVAGSTRSSYSHYCFMVLQPSPSKGLRIHLLRPGPSMGSNSPLMQPIVVQVLDAGPKRVPGVYVNSKATSWNNLAGELKYQLKLRPEWVVYVQGDPNVAWANVVNVMDVTKGLHAKVVLLTSQPSMKARKARNLKK